MSIIWFLLGFISGCFFCGIVYVSHQHYVIRKEDWNGYEADCSRYMMEGKL